MKNDITICKSMDSREGSCGGGVEILPRTTFYSALISSLADFIGVVVLWGGGGESCGIRFRLLRKTSRLGICWEGEHEEGVTR